jgi:glutamate formiminotransferase
VASVVECVPNVSEGRRPDVVAAIAEAAAVPGVAILDVTSDASHNRSVVTFAGRPDAVATAAIEIVRRAVERIDMRGHAGVHPRIGAADVVPFVPLADASMAEAVDIARRVGHDVAEQLGIPVYLYAEAALVPRRRRLANVRRGGLETLAAEIGLDGRRPDYGPARVHPTAGAVAVGARKPLIAFNVNLRSADVTLAHGIAVAIRESSGGLPAVQAMGVEVVVADGRHLAQVSTNLVDWRVTGIAEVVTAVRGLAAEEGAEVDHCELIGLAPQEALRAAAGIAPGIPDADSDSALEVRLARAGIA